MRTLVVTDACLMPSCSRPGFHFKRLLFHLAFPGVRPAGGRARRGGGQASLLDGTDDGEGITFNRRPDGGRRRTREPARTVGRWRRGGVGYNRNSNKGEKTRDRGGEGGRATA